MKPDELDLGEYIEQYIDNTLAEEEVVRFEARMKSDPEFARDVEAQKLITDVFKHPAAQRVYFKGLLKERGKQERKIRKRKTIYQRIAVAASFILFVFAGYWYMHASFQNEALIAANITDAYEGNQRADTMTPNDTYTRGIEAYKQKQFEQAATLLLAVEDSVKTTSTYLYLSKALLHIHQYEKAIPYLQIVKNSPEYFEQGQWHLALAYLGAGKEEAARSELHAIIEGEWSYGEKASKLLTRLDSPFQKLLH